jgi:hypothetical protein
VRVSVSFFYLHLALLSLYLTSLNPSSLQLPVWQYSTFACCSQVTCFMRESWSCNHSCLFPGLFPIATTVYLLASWGEHVNLLVRAWNCTPQIVLFRLSILERSSLVYPGGVASQEACRGAAAMNHNHILKDPFTTRSDCLYFLLC